MRPDSLFVVVVHVEVTGIHAFRTGTGDPEALFEAIVGHHLGLSIRGEVVVDLENGLVLLGGLGLGGRLLLVGSALRAHGLWFGEVVELRAARKTSPFLSHIRHGCLNPRKGPWITIDSRRCHVPEGQLCAAQGAWPSFVASPSQSCWTTVW